MKISLKSRVIRWAAIAGLVVPGGCVVGPDFQKPAPPSVTSYTPATTQPTTKPWTTAGVPNVQGGEPQHFINGKEMPVDIPAEWWELFHSKPLNDLIKRALAKNPDIKAAQAALTVANEYVIAQKGAYYPSVGIGFAGARQVTPKVLAPIPNTNTWTYNLFTPDVAISYTPDVFGLNRRTVESLQAQADSARYALMATDITLTANIVNAAVMEASLREQVKATKELVQSNTKMLGILKEQLAKGYANRLDVAAQEAQLAQVAALLPPLEKQLAQQRDLIAVLAGGFPSEDSPEMFTFDSIKLPGDLPVSLPSKLVQQRPDVLQAEENVHYTSALIGVAVANRLPAFTLSCDAGAMALSLGQIFSSKSFFWTLAGSVSEPVFDGGVLLHKEKAARAAFIQAQEQYRSTVLQAFQNVADTLAALQHDADALKAAVEARDAAKVTLDLTEEQMKAGYANFLALLSAEILYQNAVINLVQAQANRYADTAALFLALGGGWWNRADLTKQ